MFVTIKRRCDRYGWRSSDDYGGRIEQLGFGVGQPDGPGRWFLTPGGDGYRTKLGLHFLERLDSGVQLMAENGLTASGLAVQISGNLGPESTTPIDAVDMLRWVSRHVAAADHQNRFEEAVALLRGAANLIEADIPVDLRGVA